MAVEANLTTNLAPALSVDLAERFGLNINSLTEIMGVSRIVPMAAGSQLNVYTSSVTLGGASVAAGEIIPLSEVEIEAATPIALVWDKRRKAVPMEDVQKYGFQKAITMTDNKLINEIQKGIRSKFFTQLASGTGAASGTDFQKILAQNWAVVQGKFDEDDVETISFANPLDVADYLGAANITVQNAFGMTYVENFLNNKAIFMHGDIPQGTVYSTADQNLILAYATLAGGEVNKAFDFVSDASGLIGVTHDINKTRLTAETIAAYGLALYAERLDGIVVGTIETVAEADVRLLALDKDLIEDGTFVIPTASQTDQTAKTAWVQAAVDALIVYGTVATVTYSSGYAVGLKKGDATGTATIVVTEQA